MHIGEHHLIAYTKNKSGLIGLDKNRPKSLLPQHITNMDVQNTAHSVCSSRQASPRANYGVLCIQRHKRNDPEDPA